MKNHYSKHKDFDYAFYKHIKSLGGFHNCKFAPLLPFDSLSVKFASLNKTSLTNYQLEVLKFITQFKARAVEQALIIHFKPSYNSEKVVFNQFWFDPTIETIDNVTVSNIKGDKHYFSSITKASMYTGISQNHIRNVCNCERPIFAYSTLMEEHVQFYVKNRPMTLPKLKSQLVT